MHEQLRLTRAPSLTSARRAEALLGAVAVGHRLRVTTSWVYAETHAGRLPHISVGRYYRYRPSSIEAWLCEQERR